MVANFQPRSRVLPCFLGLGKFYVIFLQALEKDKTPRPPLYQAHGTNDTLVRYEWGKATYDKITKLGVSGEFKTYEGMTHDMNTEEIVKLKKWILQILPESSSV